MKRISLFLIIVLTAYTQSFSQDINKAKLDSLMDNLSLNNKAMGSLAISKNGKLIYHKASGFSVINDKFKMDANYNTKYRIGSISKVFTAVMIFQLIEEGFLSLNDKLNKFYPQIPNSEKISIGSMLNHHSGIYSFTNDSNYTKYMTQPKTHEEIIKIISAFKPVFEPDSKGEYSNSNYVLLGYIIEDITGKTYIQNLHERIKNKMWLDDTFYGDKTDIVKHESYSYYFEDKWQQYTETDMSIPHGAGAIVSTPTDMVRFIEALFDNKLVSAASLNQMKTMKDFYGMGLFQIPFNTKIGYGHNGAIDMFESSLVYFPDDSLAIAYCSNGLNYPMNDILIGALSIFYKLDYSVPTFKTIALKSEDLDKYLGIYSSKDIPLKITITKNGNILMAQATGQLNLALDATGKDTFDFVQAGAKFIFKPENQEMTLQQGGANILFTKDK